MHWDAESFTAWWAQVSYDQEIAAEDTHNQHLNRIMASANQQCNLHACRTILLNHVALEIDQSFNHDALFCCQGA